MKKLSFHYENLSMQRTQNCFQQKKWKTLLDLPFYKNLIFAKTIDCGYRGGSNEHSQSMFCLEQK